MAFETADTGSWAGVGYMLVLLLGALAAILHKWSKGRPKQRQTPPWQGTWLNGAIFCWGALMVFLIGIGIAGVFLEKPQDGQLTAGAIYLSLSIQLAGLGWIIFCRVFKREYLGSPWSIEGRAGIWTELKLAGYELLAGLPWIWAASIGWALLMPYLGLEQKAQLSVAFFLKDGELGTKVLLAFFAVVIAPICEETVFRGVLYRLFKKALPLWLATGLSAGLFACAHFEIGAIVPLVVIGVLLARVYEQTGSLRCCMLFHALFNLNTLILLILGGDHGAWMQ